MIYLELKAFAYGKMLFFCPYVFNCSDSIGPNRSRSHAVTIRSLGVTISASFGRSTRGTVLSRELKRYD